MTHEEICTYEVCKLAKEKGFNEKCNFYYQKGVISTDGCFNRYNKGVEYICSAPTQSLLQTWLREEKGIIVEVIAKPTCSTYTKRHYWWSIKQNSNGFFYKYEECSYLLYGDEGYFAPYELALEDALKYALENLI